MFNIVQTNLIIMSNIKQTFKSTISGISVEDHANIIPTNSINQEATCNIEWELIINCDKEGMAEDPEIRILSCKFQFEWSEEGEQSPYDHNCGLGAHVDGEEKIEIPVDQIKTIIAGNCIRPNIVSINDYGAQIYF